MCRVLKIARAGYYAWLHEPESGRTIEDRRLLQLIRSSYDASYGIYGYRRITLDLKELGESCGPNRVLKIMKKNNHSAQELAMHFFKVAEKELDAKTFNKIKKMAVA